MKTTTDTELMTATEARAWAKKIAADCTGFKSVKAVRAFFGQGWEINLDGGIGCCYGSTIRTVEGAEDTYSIFSNR
jgi:hypothetical protein